MPLVQAVVPSTEYELLRRRAKEEGKPMKTVIREALRAHLLTDEVDPDDPSFVALPLVAKRSSRHSDSTDHDQVLYRSRR